MANEVVNLNEKAKVLEKVILHGDLSKLSPQEKLNHYNVVCESLGLNSLTKPFEYITLNNKEVLYATKACTDQLRSLRKVSLTISSREKIGDVYIVTAKARIDDREDESTGAVNVANVRGDHLANAFMKAETKAKRRVTLSICGLGFLDETEVDSIPKEAKAPSRENQKAIPPPSPGDYVLEFTKEFKGKKIREIPRTQLEGIFRWCMDSEKFPAFCDAAEAFMNDNPLFNPDDVAESQIDVGGAPHES